MENGSIVVSEVQNPQAPETTDLKFDMGKPHYGDVTAYQNYKRLLYWGILGK